MEDNNKNNSIIEETTKSVETAVKTGKKLVSKDYVGATATVVDNYGKEILALFLAIIIFFISIFASGPSLVFDGIGEYISGKVTEFQYHHAQKTVEKQLEAAMKDVYKENVKKIQDGYIEKVESKIKKYNKGESTDVIGNDYFCLLRENDSDNILIFQLYGDTGDPNRFGRGARFNDVYDPGSADFDSLRFVLAYSMYHQKHDIGSDDEYKEPEDPDKRWSDPDTKGLKKFLKNNRKKLFSASYSDTVETIKIPTDQDVVCGYNSHILNISYTSMTNDDFQDLFGLTEDEWNAVDMYYQIASEFLKEKNDNAKEEAQNGTYGQVAISDIKSSVSGKIKEIKKNSDGSYNVTIKPKKKSSKDVVYKNLYSVSVKKGDKVSSGDKIGTKKQVNNSMTVKQAKVVSEAKTRKGTGKSNSCQKWVREVYEAGTGKTSKTTQSAKTAEKAWGGKKLPSNPNGLPPGCAIYCNKDGPYGHVGILGDDGKVYHNYRGKKTVESYSDFVKKHRATSWGWQNGDDLTKGDD